MDGQHGDLGSGLFELANSTRKVCGSVVRQAMRVFFINLLAVLTMLLLAACDCGT
jgi:hypothetical protein